MIKSKKLLAIVCVLTMIVSVFSGLTVSAATIPAGGLTITYNESESSTTNIVLDVTTTAAYINAGSIVWDISAIWSSIDGSTFAKKGTTISNASTFGTAIATNKEENGSTAKITCLTSKKLKIQLASSTSALPFDFETTGSNVIAKVVIPLTTALTEDVTFAVDTASTYLAAGVADETSDSGYSFVDQYLNAGAMTINTTTLTAKGPAPAETITVADATVDGAKMTWAVTATPSLINALTAKLYNTNTSASTDAVSLSWGETWSGDGDCTFNVITNLKDANNAQYTELEVASGSVSGRN